jgi:protein involved in polysaccharide export with SLBB domain
VNSVKYWYFFVHKRGLLCKGIIALSFVLLLLAICLAGCSDKVTLPTTLEMLDFENAGPSGPTIDIDRLTKAKIGGGSYRVETGDVLELIMPAILQAVTKDEYKEGEKYAPYACRVSDSGTITLPLTGELKVAGLTLAQIETSVIDQYYPKYAVTRPSVYSRIVEYKVAKVSITGAVNKPGIYSLRSDQMSLVALLMEAGGIVNEGAAIIRINSSDQVEQNNERITGQAKQEKTVQTSQQIAGSVDKAFFKNSTDSSINKSNIDVQLAFQQYSPHSTTGYLVVRNGQTTLLNEQLDITDQQERAFMVKLLSWREPRIQSNDIEQQLKALAEILKTNSTSPNSQKELTLQNPQFSPVLAKQDFLKTPKASSLGFYADSSNLTNLSSKDSARLNNQTIALPVRGLNVPFADVVLHDGDSVVVERLQLPLFSVLGLVDKPGNFQYPMDVQYNLMQALAFAGGLDRTAEPRYATIYRLKPDGTIVHATLQVERNKKAIELQTALSTKIKPGDIIAVEHTPRTRTNKFLGEVFRINIGTYYNLSDAWTK